MKAQMQKLFITLFLLLVGLLLDCDLAWAKVNGEAFLSGDTGDMFSSEPFSQEGKPLFSASVTETHTVTYTYDDAGRLVGVDYGGDKCIAYTYDAGGNLLSREVLITVTGVVEPETGGTLVYTDSQGHETTVEAPSGAVSERITLLYMPVASPTHALNDLPGLGQLRFAGHAFTLEARQGGSLVPGFTFLEPVTVIMHYSDEDVAGVHEDSLTLNYWDGVSWTDAATTCMPSSTYDRHPGANWLALPICHLSEFALLGRTASVTLDGPPTTTVNMGAVFTATVATISQTLKLPASAPLTYTWQASGLPFQTHVTSRLMDTARLTWTIQGVQAVTVTVSDPYDTSVSDTHALDVVGGMVSGYPIYLPMVLRNDI